MSCDSSSRRILTADSIMAEHFTKPSICMSIFYQQNIAHNFASRLSRVLSFTNLNSGSFSHVLLPSISLPIRHPLRAAPQQAANLPRPASHTTQNSRSYLYRFSHLELPDIYSPVIAANPISPTLTSLPQSHCRWPWQSSQIAAKILSGLAVFALGRTAVVLP